MSNYQNQGAPQYNAPPAGQPYGAQQQQPYGYQQQQYLYGYQQQQPYGQQQQPYGYQQQQQQPYGYQQQQQNPYGYQQQGYTQHGGGYSQTPSAYHTAAAQAHIQQQGPPGSAPSGYNPYSTTYSGSNPIPATVAPSPNHSAPPPGCPSGVDPTLWQVFRTVDSDNSGTISAKELQLALANNNWSQFNAETCRLLIGLFDKNKDGSIDVCEFAHLWKYIQDWRNCFTGFDKDGSGTIDYQELQQAFHSFGYILSIDFCRLCTRVFDKAATNSMNFDSFIHCCVMLRGLSDAFQRKDVNRNGTIQISYEDFLEMVIDNSIEMV